MPECDKPNMRKFVAALRSREYPQGKNRLRYQGSYQGKVIYRYCCLGVACDVAMKDGFRARWSDDEDTAKGEPRGFLFVSENEGDTPEKFALPSWIMKYYGLDESANEELDLGLWAESAARMNDTGRSHAFIADALEEHFMLKEENAA